MDYVEKQTNKQKRSRASHQIEIVYCGLKPVFSLYHRLLCMVYKICFIISHSTVYFKYMLCICIKALYNLFKKGFRYANLKKLVQCKSHDSITALKYIFIVTVLRQISAQSAYTFNELSLLPIRTFLCKTFQPSLKYIRCFHFPYDSYMYYKIHIVSL